MDNNKKTIILGAGLTGLSTAYHLKENYRIFEKDAVAGGLCKSSYINGFTFDLTGHLLHLRDDYARNLVRSLLGRNLLDQKRKAWIFSKNTYTRYPFQAHTFGLPKNVIKECLSDFFAAQAKLKRFKKPSHTLSDWIMRYFGKGIGRHFMVPYNEKLWQRPLSEITPEWTGPFVPHPSVQEVLKGSLTDTDSSMGYNAHFLYPRKKGIQTLVNGFISQLKIPPEVQSEAVRIRWYDRRVEIAGKGPIMYNNLVSTMPLPLLIDRMHRVPSDIIDAAKSLKWVSILCINLGFKCSHVPDRHWIYFPEKEFNFYRVGFHSNFSPFMAPKNCSSVYIEIAHRPGKPLNLKKTLNQVTAGLQKADILRQQDTILKIQVIPIPYAYVVYDFNRTPAVDRIQSFLQKHNIISTGRYGGWKYSYMEEAILDGKKTAEKIISTQ